MADTPDAWKTFTSQSAAASATGIPLTLIRSANKGGCAAFHSNRIYAGPELLRWIFETSEGQAALMSFVVAKVDEDDGDYLTGVADWSVEDKKFSALLKKQKLEKEQGAVIDKTAAHESLQVLMAMFASESLRAAEENSVACVGLDAMQALKVMKENHGDMFEQIERRLLELQAAEGVTDEEIEAKNL